jgi:RNA polymerase sigma-70 factor, ECF subfamily
MHDIPQDIIERAQAGDMEAFEDIYKAASGYVYTIAMKITRLPEDAQEVTQDVFLQVHRHLKGFKNQSSFKTWLYRVATNTALNRYQRMKRERQREINMDETIFENMATHEKPAEDESQMNDRAAQMLSCLNTDQKTCLMMRTLEGLSYQEIAETLNININTVRSRLKRARQTLICRFGKGGRDEM